MGERWYEEAVIYCLDVETFQDSNDDGVGDFRGLIGRLDYLSRLGVTCIWLNPIHPGPSRDDGYDVTDFYAVDPRLGTLGDFAELLHQCRNRGIRVILDLVINHTSDEHPWFQSAISSKDSPYRDWYVWSEDEPANRRQGMVFPGEQEETWTYHRKAGAWYYHRFYDFQPDLNAANPAVRAEMKKIVAFWLQLGVDGFRIDAAPFIIELTEAGREDGSPKDFKFLTELRELVQWRKGDAVLLAEANVEPSALVDYFGDSGGSANRLHMLFDFMLNGRLVLALARENPEPVIDTLRDSPDLPSGAQWATFLRNHDEIDLSRLTAEQRSDVFKAFGPDENMHLYDRGIRRRLASMLGGDRRRIELAYSLQFTLRGTPVLRYGEEIGMGEDLSLPGRFAIRTPMQWSFDDNGGFSAAKPIRPVISTGPYGYKKVNVTEQRYDKNSLLAWFERMIHTLRESPEVGGGQCTILEQKLPPSVLAHRADGPTGTMLFLHNLGREDVCIDLGSLWAESNHPNQVFGDQDYALVGKLDSLDLAGYGYRWIRLRRNPSG
jgi:maltose alpha-D-glucosyltransferase/alpha-amylase